MHWNRWYAIKSYLLSTIWIAPAIALVLEQATFRVAYAVQFDFGWVPGFVFDREGTIAVADYIIGSCTAFIVFTFSSLLVAIQVASGQLTPRIIATTLLRDKSIRRAVALFVYTLLLAIAVKSRVEGIPHFLISLLGILGLVSVLVFMFLIDYAARLLRPVSIVSRLAQQGLRVIDDVYPRPLSPTPNAAATPGALGEPERTVVHDDSSAIVIAVNVTALIAAATRVNAVIELVPRVGDFVARGELLFRVRGKGAEQIGDQWLRGQVAFGRERTIEQDSTFAFRVIVDIAIKALSPAINDPTTAVLALDQLQRLLHTVGERSLHDERIFDRDHRLRVILRTPNWQDFVQLTFSEIRRYGAANFQVARRMRATMETLLQTLPPSRVGEIHQQLSLLNRTLEERYSLPEDLALAQLPDTQGLGGASSS